MLKIEINIDIYGSKARSSALADFLEIMAIGPGSFSKADLEDLIEDSGWARKLTESYTQTDSSDELDSIERSQKVFDLLQERRELLGESYPFQVQSNRLVFDKQTRGNNAYLVLLGISASHAYGHNTPTRHLTQQDPKQLFEEIVVIAMKNQGMLSKSTAFGTKKGIFSELLREELGPALGISPTPERSTISKSAKDEKVDIVCVIGGKKDRRPGGRWFFIGQVTCAKSDQWLRKLSEPEPPKWQKILGIQSKPAVFLAIPYQIEKRHTLSILESDRGIVYDRLRLVPYLQTNLDNYQAFADILETFTITT